MAGGNKLTEAAVKQAKPLEKIYKLADGAGLYLEVSPTGSKYWRLKYRYAGKEKRLALGVYPTVTLTKAREKMREAKAQLLAEGDDPGAIKKQTKLAKQFAQANTFEGVGREFLGKRKQEGAAEVTLRKIQWILDQKLCPFIVGAYPFLKLPLFSFLPPYARLKMKVCMKLPTAPSE